MLRRVVTQSPRRMLVARPPTVPARNISISAQRMSPLKPLDNPVSSVLPSDAFQLLPEAEKAGPAEDALYEQQLKDVEAWWASPRYKGIKRPYSAADVVSKRGSQMHTYASSVMARKLFNLITEREAVGEPIHTSMFALQYLEPPGLTICSGSN
jgi:isocitrate lyase